MAETDPQVMSMVEAALEKNPDASSQDLYDQIKKKKRSIGKLTLRQFHAKYPLQVKRRKKSGAKGKAKKAKAPRAKATRAKSTGRAKAPRAKATKRGRRATKRAASAAPVVVASGSGELNRDVVRAVMLEFAADLAAADSRQGAVRVVANVDRYLAKMG